MRPLFLVLAAALAASCCNQQTAIPRPSAADTPNCKSACARLREKHCPEGDDLPDKTTCEAFCEATSDAGHAMNAACVMTIASCDELHTKCGE